MKIVQLAQSSTEWLLWRQTGIGSSDAPVIWNGVHFERTRLDLYQEKLKLVQPRTFPPFVEKRMRRGHVLEPDVRRWYETLMGVQAHPICCVHTTEDWLKGSLDGWVPQSQTILEIKCPGKKDHEAALAHQIPVKYLPQVNHLLLVTGAQGCHYVSYNPDYPRKERHALVRYKPDRQDLQELYRLEKIFIACLESRTEPADHLFLPER